MNAALEALGAQRQADAAAASSAGASAAVFRPAAMGEPSDEDEDDNGRSFEAFERLYAADHSWEELQEDEQGNLRPLDATAELRARRQRAMTAAQSGRIRKGMIRYVLLVVDLSRAASASDLRPSRLSVMAGACRAFMRSFFDLNPLGQLGVLLLRNGIAERLTDLSGSPEAQIAKLKQYGLDTGGDASLQNGLDLALEQMAGAPPYVAREVLLLMAALSTVDPGRVEDSIQACKAARLRVSVVGVAAEVAVLRRTADVTGGTYGVALSEGHLAELLLAHAPPPPAPPGQLSAELVRMGFPTRAPGDASTAVYVGELPVLAAGSYTCPRCKARTQELPCKCHVCGLTLISSPHLARSYHHLFPVAAFAELDQQQLLQAAAAQAGSRSCSTAGVGWHESDGRAEARAAGVEVLECRGAATSSSAGLCCYGCLRPLAVAGAVGGLSQQASMVLRCGVCRRLFCFDCDALIHESLHNCPGCECGVDESGQLAVDD